MIHVDHFFFPQTTVPDQRGENDLIGCGITYLRLYVYYCYHYYYYSCLQLARVLECHRINFWLKVR